MAWRSDVFQPCTTPHETGLISKLLKVLRSSSALKLRKPDLSKNYMTTTGATLKIILIINGELASCGNNQVEIPCVTDFPGVT